MLRNDLNTAIFRHPACLPALSRSCPCFQAPPELKVEIEGVVCLPVTNGIKCLRGVCNERLKYEVEYSLKKGTSENSYLLSVSTDTHCPQLACVTSFHLPPSATSIISFNLSYGGMHVYPEHLLRAQGL